MRCLQGLILDLSTVSCEATTKLTKCLYGGLQKNRCHTQIHTQDNRHNIFLFFLFFSLFGNCRVNIFITHITWHDAPNFTLSVYRNTLNRTQGFTMDTRLTFCPLHLQQWMTFSRFFDSVFFFQCFPLLSSPCRSYPSNQGSPDSLTKTSYFVVAVEVLFSPCFTNTICIETIHGLDMFLNTSFVPLL